MNKPLSRREVTHNRILETAARAIRRGGFHGVGVADIMKDAGLTHGGFYAHFSTRDAMLAEALERAGNDSAERLITSITATREPGVSFFKALVEGYLSEQHLRACESGCPVAALVSEMPRQTPEVRAAGARRVTSLMALIGAAMPDGAQSDSVIAVVSQLIGALQLARALGDNAEGHTVLASARRHLLAQFDTAHAGAPPP